MTTRRPVVPKHLKVGGAGRRLWRSVADGWLLDRRQLEVLRLACEAADRADEARALLDAEGLTVRDRYDQVKPHPAASIETANRAQVERLLRALSLEPTGDDPRPPRIA